MATMQHDVTPRVITHVCRCCILRSAYVARHPRQEASLFGGSLRRNLDPFNRYPDALLWGALDTVQLKVKVEHLPGKLYAEMIDFGNNFSLGER